MKTLKNLVNTEKLNVKELMYIKGAVETPVYEGCDTKACTESTCTSKACSSSSVCNTNICGTTVCSSDENGYAHGSKL
jgi:hypothetical protein